MITYRCFPRFLTRSWLKPKDWTPGLVLDSGAQVLKSRHEISYEGLGPLLDYCFSPLDFFKIARYYLFRHRSPLGALLDQILKGFMMQGNV